MSDSMTDLWRRRTLRVHGTVLLLVTVFLTVTSTIGWRTASGPWSILAGNDWALVGFYQAYMLMFLIGTALWIGSFGSRPVAWDWIGAAAHLVPLSIMPVAWGAFAREGLLHLPVASIVFHLLFIGVELSAIFLAPRLAARAG